MERRHLSARRQTGIARPAATMAVGTVLSRVTGLGRLVAMTAALGISESRLADTFNVANTLPNILYELVLGGVLSAAFVPLVVESLRRDDGLRSIGTLVGTALAVLAAMSLVATFAAPRVINLFTGGGSDEPAATALATFFFRFFAWQIVFYGMAAIYGGLLNARGNFALPAIAPVANNVIAILVFAAFAVVSTKATAAPSTGAKLLLGAGTTAAVAAMALIQLGPARRALGRRLPLRIAFTDPLVRRFARLSAWTVAFVAVTQVAFAVVVALAYDTQGGAAAYFAANTFFQLPVGVLAVSVMTALVPLLAERATEWDESGFARRLEQGIAVTVAVTVPAMVGYLLVARPAMTVLIQHGETTAASADFVARILRIFILGLVGYSLWLLFLRAWYSRQDARTPFVLNLFRGAVSVALCIVLYPKLKVEGLAWAESISYSAGALASGFSLRRRLGHLDWAHAVRVLVRVAVASGAMALALWPVIGLMGSRSRSFSGAAVTLVLATAVGGAVFYAAASRMRVDEITAARSFLRRTPAGPPPRASDRP